VLLTTSFILVTDEARTGGWEPARWARLPSLTHHSLVPKLRPSSDTDQGRICRQSCASPRGWVHTACLRGFEDRRLGIRPPIQENCWITDPSLTRYGIEAFGPVGDRGGGGGGMVTPADTADPAMPIRPSDLTGPGHYRLGASRPNIQEPTDAAPEHHRLDSDRNPPMTAHYASPNHWYLDSAIAAFPAAPHDGDLT
jgi:hypothetical protein